MATLIIQPEAEVDIDAALSWYDRQGPGLTQRLLNELDFAFDRIRENPVQFPVAESPVRRVLLQKFPYSVYFFQNEDVAHVIAVIHQKRHPETWKHHK